MGMLLRRHKAVVSEPVVEPVSTAIPNIEPEIKETVEEKHYSKSDIAAMSTANLQALAVELGIEDATEISGNKLKPIIVNKLGL